jgi:hypothetical protein
MLSSRKRGMIRVIGNTIEFNGFPVATIREGIGATEYDRFIETVKSTSDAEALREELKDLREFYGEYND